MESLDERMKDEKSNQSLRQMKKRLIAIEASSCPKPAGHSHHGHLANLQNKLSMSYIKFNLIFSM